MLVQFSVRNYKTFKDRATLSLVASNYDKETREEENVVHIEKFGLRLLKSAVVYGANASGKSKLFEAIDFMERFTQYSFPKSLIESKIHISPFKLNSETENAPSEFEIVFVVDDVMYRYGFELDESIIHSEWLFKKEKRKEVELFYREKQKFRVHPREFVKGKKLVRDDSVRDNALLLSAAANNNDTLSLKLLQWFKYLTVVSTLDEIGYPNISVGRVMSNKGKDQIISLLKVADIDVEDIYPLHADRKNIPSEMMDELQYHKFQTEESSDSVLLDFSVKRKVFNSNKEYVATRSLSMSLEESSGTQAFFNVSGILLLALDIGMTLIIDELGSKLHPNLVNKIVALFNSKETNKKNAQLIFNTHDTNLLSTGLLRRDQIWFTEKNTYGEASLYSLEDFTKVKKEDPIEKNYLRGKYGAVPYLGGFDDISTILEKTHEQEK